jgi:hypothetical protein
VRKKKTFFSCQHVQEERILSIAFFFSPFAQKRCFWLSVLFFFRFLKVKQKRRFFFAFGENKKQKFNKEIC